MKGTILDFNNNEMVGLILGKDGNRYTFNIETDWQNKSKFPEIDNIVDFIINDNKATQIYCLNNKSLEPIETKNNESFTNNKIFKKIDFEKLENELNNEENLKKTKKELRYEFYFFIILGIGTWLIAESFKGGEIMGFILLLILFTSIVGTVKSFFALFFSKDKLEEDIIEKLYKKDLTIISYVPENLNYEVIQLISAIDNSEEEAKKELITEAFKLKADAIINYKHDLTKSSVVKGKRGRVNTEVRTTHKVEGVAIKVN